MSKYRRVTPIGQLDHRTCKFWEKQTAPSIYLLMGLFVCSTSMYHVGDGAMFGG